MQRTGAVWLFRNPVAKPGRVWYPVISWIWGECLENVENCLLYIKNRFEKEQVK